MIPGELLVADGEIELNVDRKTVTVNVQNVGDRPIQVGSHYHFHETNSSLRFDRETCRGYRLDIPAGAAGRFRPGAGADRAFGRIRWRAPRLWFSGEDHGRPLNGRENHPASLRGDVWSHGGR